MKNSEKVISIVIGGVLTFILALIVNYFAMPAWSVHSTACWLFVIVLIFVFAACVGLCECLIASYRTPDIAPILAIIGVVAIIVWTILGAAGSKMFHAEEYSNVIQYETGNFADDMLEVESVENIALMDSETARVFANRALGSLSKIVSQYELAEECSQINLNGKPMKVFPLEYGSFFKWNKNKDTGIPGYILVDPVSMEAKYVELEEGMKYSPSASFSQNLNRHLRKKYPNWMFDSTYFEVDDSGKPYWVTTVSKATIGNFGCRIIDKVILTDPVSGDTEVLKLDEIPSWIDIVFHGDYISELFNYHGMLANGYWNFSKTGCKKTTNDFGYVILENDVYIYTGVTSAAGDSSTIGVILANERTGEVTYYDVAGADERSAMDAAEGEVQEKGYTASFPSLINVNGQPTYIMVLVDANHIVKSYAMVNLENYSKVVVAETQKEVFSKYAEKMGFATEDTTEATTEVATEETTEVVETGTLINISFTVNSVEFIVNDGNTIVYIYTEENVYKSDFDEFWILAKEGTEVNAQYYDTYAKDKIIKLENFE